MSYLFLNQQGQLTAVKTSQPQFTGVSYQTSAQAIPIPIFWGCRRLSPNVIWWAPPLQGGPNQGVSRSVLVNDSPVGAWLPGFGAAAFGQVIVNHVATSTQSVYYDNGNNPTDSAATWWVPMIMALCEGPLDATNTISRAWNGGSGVWTLP